MRIEDESIVGHEHLMERLRHMAEGDPIRAFVFSGPEAVGKFSVALWWAEMLTDIAADTRNVSEIRPDILLVEPRKEVEKGITKERPIAVKDIRTVLKELALKPYSGQRRVLIVRDAHVLTEEAQNALLKTLEEPPVHAVIVLVTHRIGRLLPTVLSRCQRMDFVSVSLEKMHQEKVFRDCPEELLRLGRPGLAFRFMEEPKEVQSDVEQVRALERVGEKSWSERLALAEKLSKDPGRLCRLLEWWAVAIRSDGVGPDEDVAAGILLAGKVAEVLQRVQRQPSSTRLAFEELLLSL